MLSGSGAAYTLASTLLEAARARLAASPAGAPDRVCVVPGAIAWDDCQCGQLAVSIERAYMADAIQSQQNQLTTSNCAAAWMVVDLVVQVVRCAPQPQGHEVSVACAQLEASAAEVLTDAYEVLRAVVCTLDAMEDADEIADQLVRAQQIIGPGGACVGSEVRASVALGR